MLGVPFAERGAMTDEYLQAMRELWSSPDPSFAGKYNQFSGLKFAPKPVQQPHPPIWVGGHSRAALRRAVAFGAAWHPINRSPDELRAGRDQLERLSRSAGRTIAPAITLRNDVRILKPGQVAPSSTHAGRVLAGKPPVLIAHIRELAECGVEHLVLEFLAEDGQALSQQLTAFAREVRPAFS
jgi:alkanesulfonate monooxygenase SsuD/methylene tetrahydromethanopterin reductase-like flavin-dependent oxidoreductase (luciferase family)